MQSFFTLVSIEYTKIWKRMLAKVLLILMAVIILGLMGVSKYVEVRNSDSKSGGAGASQSQTADWRKQARAEIVTLRAQSKSADANSLMLGYYQKNIAEQQYRLDHNIPPEKETGFWEKVSSAGVGSLLALFLIIVGSTAVAGEFSEGTMKTMISRPYGRSQILSAKLAATLLYGLELLAGTFLFLGLCTGIFFGFGGIGAKELMWTGGSMVYLPGAVKALAILGLDFVQIVVYLIMAFAIAAVFRSRALATGISLFLLLVGSTIAQVLAVYFSWGKYILFCNTSLSTYITYGTMYPGTSLGFSLLVSAAYSAVFLLLGYLVFAKRDI